jgi:hypothetical protein
VAITKADEEEKRRERQDEQDRAEVARAADIAKQQSIPPESTAPTPAELDEITKTRLARIESDRERLFGLALDGKLADEDLAAKVALLDQEEAFLRFKTDDTEMGGSNADDEDDGHDDQSGSPKDVPPIAPKPSPLVRPQKRKVDEEEPATRVNAVKASFVNSSSYVLR